MKRAKPIQDNIVHRLKIAKGHLDKVLKMVEAGDYCIDVIHQSQAVQRQISEADQLLLENHLKTCTADAIKKGKKDVAIKEIMSILKKSKP